MLEAKAPEIPITQTSHARYIYCCLYFSLVISLLLHSSHAWMLSIAYGCILSLAFWEFWYYRIGFAFDSAYRDTFERKYEDVFPPVKSIIGRCLRAEIGLSMALKCVGCMLLFSRVSAVYLTGTVIIIATNTHIAMRIFTTHSLLSQYKDVSGLRLCNYTLSTGGMLFWAICRGNRSSMYFTFGACLIGGNFLCVLYIILKEIRI